MWSSCIVHSLNCHLEPLIVSKAQDFPGYNHKCLSQGDMVPLYLPNGVVGLYQHYLNIRSHGSYVISKLLTIKVSARVVYDKIRGSLVDINPTGPKSLLSMLCTYTLDKPGYLEACGLVNYL